MSATSHEGGVRLAELVASLSLAIDLGMGQPMQHCMRQAVIGLRLADRLELDEADRVATYYLGLMANVFCHADASEQARWFGDDISFKRDGYDTLAMNTTQIIAFMVRRVGSGGTGRDRAQRLATFPGPGYREMTRFMSTHSTLGAQFARRIGLDAAVGDAIAQGYEHWDGKGRPRHLAGAAITPAARLVPVAVAAEIFHRTRGLDAACAIVNRHRGAQFDPAVVDAFCESAPELVADLDAAAEWDAVVAAEPGLERTVTGAELDRVLEAMGDLIDMKSPYTAGHSRGVAHLAATAAAVSGVSDRDRASLRRAGFIHDLGRLGVSNTIWEKPGPLTHAEMERVRLHPYFTDRILAGVAALTPARELSARHHERLDGSGYPGGLSAASLSPGDRLLAAADVYHALTEPRAYRPAFGFDRAADELRAEVRAGRLDGDAVNAVLTAAGHRASARRDWPAGLTAREVEVLGEVARGYSNKQIAQRLYVAPKTVSNHVEHIYSKIGVSSRAAATLFATQHGLVGSFVPSDTG